MPFISRPGPTHIGYPQAQNGSRATGGIPSTPVAPMPVRAGSIKAVKSFTSEAEASIAICEITRTPSPTPSEAELLSHKARPSDFLHIFDYRRYINNRARLSMFHPHPQIYVLHTDTASQATLLVALVLLAFIAAFLANQHKIEDALRPVSGWLHEYICVVFASFP